MNKENSVLSLKVTKAIYKVDRPYAYPTDKISIGTGFIIDISKGLIVTNAHVVENAISIIGRLSRTGRRDISMKLLGICREKDVAICKLDSSDISLIVAGLTKEEISNLNLKFADSMDVSPGDVVTILGYPVNFNNVKMLTTTVSGFEILNKRNNLNEIEDSYLRSPSYIQINSVINPGNSGSPLLNLKGEIIGINTDDCSDDQNVGYAIPSRTFLTIYNELINNDVVKLPTLGIEWCKTNRELMKKQTGSSSTYGIYIRKVYPDSCFDLLEKGDIVRRIDYIDMFWDTNGRSSIKPLSELNLNGTLVTVFFDRFGLTNKIGKLKNPDEVDENKIEYEKIFTNRKLELSELMDMVPIGTEILMNICRNSSWYKLKSKYIHIPSERIPHIYPKIQPYDYEIFAGICVMNLNIEHIEYFENLSCYSQDSENRYKKQVVIVQVFPETSAFKTQVLKPGHLIKSILGFSSSFELMDDTNRLITSLEDIRHILSLNPQQIQITTTDGSPFVISTSNIIKEDESILSDYKISHKYILDLKKE